MYVWKQLSPSQPHRLQLGVAFGITDTGTVRASNEDNFLIDPALGLVALADGMGGHEAGEVASAEALLAVAHFLRASMATQSEAPVRNFRPSPFDPEEADPDAFWTDTTMSAMITLHDAVEFANQRMYQTNVDNRRGDGGGMGTTLTGLWHPAPEGPVYVFHIGDSRLYVLRDDELIQLTDDQTLYQQALDAGVTDNLPPRNLLLQAIGPSSEIETQLHIHQQRPNDLFMLCSDGLYGNTTEEDIADALRAAQVERLGDCCAALIEMAKQDGSRDNITVVLLQCQPQTHTNNPDKEDDGVSD